MATSRWSSPLLLSAVMHIAVLAPGVARALVSPERMTPRAVAAAAQRAERDHATIEVAFESAPPPDDAHHDGQRPGLARAHPDDGRMALLGPADNPDPHVSRWPGNTALGAATARRGHEAIRRGAGSAVSAPWGRTTSRGLDTTTAAAHVLGERPVTIAGVRGLSGNAKQGDG